MGLKGTVRAHTGKLVAVAAVVVFHGLAQLPQITDAERQALASSFRFERYPLPGEGSRKIRNVHPELQKFAGWISSVGAAIAFADVDGDGLYNDICLVDPRGDAVIVAPAPPDDGRFRSFRLSTPEDVGGTRSIAPMGCLPGDLNEDGYTDFLVYYWGRTPVAFLRKVAAGGGPEQAPPTAAAFAAVDVPATRAVWNSNAGVLADIDGDGHLDLVIGNYFADAQRILDPADTGPVHMQDSMSRAFNGGRNRILLWRSARSGSDPGVTFTDTSDVLDERIRRGWTLAVGAADLDGDLLPELYFANDFGPDRLLVNRSRKGRPAFQLVEGVRTPGVPRSSVLGRDSFKGMGVDFADIDGDGRLDIYVSNIAEEFALQESHFLFVNTGDERAFAEGRAPFINRSEALGLSRSSWSWDVKLADFNNDGVLEAIQATGFVRGVTDRWPELHELAMGNDELVRHPGAWPRFSPGDGLSGERPNPFFVRARDGRYYDLAPELGLDEPWESRGIAIADVDGDGDLDFAIANQWQSSFLFLNTRRADNAFLVLDIRFPISGMANPTQVFTGPMAGPVPLSRPAIGAAVVVTVPGKGGSRQLIGQVDGGNGHSGVRAPELHFGLGPLPAATPLGVRIRWRDSRGVQRRDLTLRPGRHTILIGHETIIAE